MTAAGSTDVTVGGLDGVRGIGPDSGRADALHSPGRLDAAPALDIARQRAPDALRRTNGAHTAPDGVRFGAIV